MELIIIFALLVLVAFVLKNFNSFVYLLVIVDIFFRIVHFLKNNIASSELQRFVSNNIPASIPSLINQYTSGIFNEILIWFYVINFIILEVYLIKKLIKNK